MSKYLDKELMLRATKVMKENVPNLPAIINTNVSEKEMDLILTGVDTVIELIEEGVFDVELPKPILGGKFKDWSDEELWRTFLYFGNIKDTKLDPLLLNMYAALVSRGYDPTNLTYLEDDNDIVDAEVNPATCEVILSIPQEFKGE